MDKKAEIIIDIDTSDGGGGITINDINGDLCYDEFAFYSLYEIFVFLYSNSKIPRAQIEELMCSAIKETSSVLARVEKESQIDEDMENILKKYGGDQNSNSNNGN